MEKYILKLIGNHKLKSVNKEIFDPLMNTRRLY